METQKRIELSIPGITKLLPERCFRTGSIVEWVSDQNGCHVIPVAISSIKESIRSNQRMMIIDHDHSFFPAVLSRWGIPLQHVVIIRPQAAIDALWATEQALRCRGLAVVLCLGIEIQQRQFSHCFRRFQLAAEHGQTLGMFVRSGSSIPHSPWADHCLRVKPLETSALTGNRRIQIKMNSSRLNGGINSSLLHHNVILHIDEFSGHITHETNRVPVVPAVATPTAFPVQAGA